jgi:predicted RNA-binding protein
VENREKYHIKYNKNKIIMKFRIENDNVVCYITPDNKKYEQSKIYRIDLSERKMYLEDNLVTWDLPEEIECQIVESGIKDANLYVESCYSLLYSYRLSNDSKNIAKQERILENNKKIREFLGIYKAKYCNLEI